MNGLFFYFLDNLNLIDFGILIDFLDLVVKKYWLKMLEFVFMIVDFFDIFVGGIYVGLIVFSCDVEIFLYFNIL